MRVAALYDIHGNLPALLAVLEDVAREDVSALVIGGDVATGPLPAETTAALMALPDSDAAGQRAYFVRGNADREIVEAYDATEPAGDPVVAHATERISAAERDFLAGFPTSVALEIDGLGPALFCHGSPRSDSEMITSATSEERLRPMLDGIEQQLVVCGHTHRQFDRQIDGQRVVNAGSVGLPYEGRPGAFWALLGPQVELRCTSYDVDRACVQLRGGGLAAVDDWLGESLLEPADPDEVAEIFERRALEAESAG